MTTEKPESMAGLLKTLFWGGIPQPLLDELERERLVVMDESIWTRLNFWKYRSRRGRFGRRTHGKLGWVVLTESRFAGAGYSTDHVNLRFDSIRSDNLKVAVARPDRLKLDFNAEDFEPDRRGRMVCRYHTAHARTIADRLIAEMDRA